MPAALSTVPVVRGQTDLWPLELLTPGAAIPGWQIAYCRSRQDKALADDLRQMGIPRVIFLQNQLRRYRGKGVQERSLPLLAGYVFCVGDATVRERIFRTERTLRVMPVAQTATLTRELQALAALVDRSPTPLIVRPELVQGMQVTLTQGTFAGLSGVIVRRHGTTDLVVNLAVLGSSVAVNLPADFADPAALA